MTEEVLGAMREGTNRADGVSTFRLTAVLTCVGHSGKKALSLSASTKKAYPQNTGHSQNSLKRVFFSQILSMTRKFLKKR